jgi:anti-anti-sigma factor
MEKMLVAVFDEESKAYEGWRALKQLDEQGTVVVYTARVVVKNPDGTLTVKRSDFEFPIHAVGGTAIGALIGLLGAGPLGAIGGTAVGGIAGDLGGSLPDFYRAEVNAEFLAEVSAALQPGKFAVVADIREDSASPIDAEITPLGGTVIRILKRDFDPEQRAKAVATLRAEIEQTKAELARAHADLKAVLQAKIDEKQAKLKNILAYAREQLEIHEREIQGIRILDLHGHIVAGRSEARLREQITALTESGAVNVILNCDSVMDIDADGLACLVWCSARLRYAGGALKLLKVRWDHMDLIAHAGLGKEFEVFSDEVSALNSFFSERTVPTFDVLEYAKQQRKETSDRVT